MMSERTENLMADIVMPPNKSLERPAQARTLASSSGHTSSKRKKSELGKGPPGRHRTGMEAFRVAVERKGDSQGEAR